MFCAWGSLAVLPWMFPMLCILQTKPHYWANGSLSLSMSDTWNVLTHWLCLLSHVAWDHSLVMSVFLLIRYDLSRWCLNSFSAPKFIFWTLVWRCWSQFGCRVIAILLPSLFPAPFQPWRDLNLRILCHKESSRGACMPVSCMASWQFPHRHPWVCVEPASGCVCWPCLPSFHKRPCLLERDEK